MIDLALLIVSLPIGMELVGWAANFPDNPGDHNPGLGVAWALLFIVWFICLLVWLVLGVEVATLQHLGV